ncbi:type II toxin-antitoxin system HicA family toxin [Phyllobacterium sp. BT25]|uniref:Type II toxin-antitoxin system HicA family toxin n=1 Tax=Phyllobacterium pellucidum TaxID=2740464 RepID=A0A849VS22_9HYPH|nr:type II toxin-antitoxin system HicA family toxin [Phyllobacterium pellucidum]NTS31774.1 type II toxin-antitoxin system HicA family toxin [Phyllobacterium pellucidum]
MVLNLKRRHRVTLQQIFARPASGSIRWSDVEALLLGLGAEITEREGSRFGVFLFGEIRVFHRPHPSPDTDKGAIASIRKWLESHGIRP